MIRLILIAFYLFVIPSPVQASQGISIFPNNSQSVVMFWYYSLATLSGAFIFLTVVKSGYKHIFSGNTNPGMRASAILTVQRAIVGLIIIMVAPLLINILITINNVFVSFCLDLINGTAQVSTATIATTEPVSSDSSFMEQIVAWPFLVFLDILEKLFGLKPLGEVIFNEMPKLTILSQDVTSGDFVNTGNAFADVLLSLSMLGFTAYFNAVYILRRFVVIAVVAVTPIIIWIWVLAENKNVIGIWLAEIIQTIFMQSFHALTFGIIFSVLAFSHGSIKPIAGENMAYLLVGLGKYAAAFGGVACVAVLIFQAYRIIFNNNERERAEALSRIKKALIGLIILGLSYMITAAIFPSEIGIYDSTSIEVDAPVTVIESHPEEDKITIFTLFFALIAVIPISKMMSYIFIILSNSIADWSARQAKPNAIFVHSAEEAAEKLADIIVIEEKIEVPQYDIKQSLFILTYANKGGVGKTTSAISIGITLSRAGIPTVICDFDYGGLDIGTFFKIKKKAANYLGQPDVTPYLHKINENLFILPGPADITLSSIQGRDIVEAVRQLKEKFPVVIGDTFPSASEHNYMYDVFEESNLVYAVVDQSQFSIQETAMYAPKLLLMGVYPGNIRIIVNKFNPKLKSIREIEKAFCSGFKREVKKLPKVVGVIPEGWEEQVKAMYKGRIINEDVWEGIVKEIVRLLGKEISTIEPENNKEGFFSFWRRRK